jgi:hypothetical protein
MRFIINRAEKKSASGTHSPPIVNGLAADLRDLPYGDREVDMAREPSGVRVLVATRVVDFRKGMDGLAALARESICGRATASTTHALGLEATPLRPSRSEAKYRLRTRRVSSQWLNLMTNRDHYFKFSCRHPPTNYSIDQVWKFLARNFIIEAPNGSPRFARG